jgi:photosystem II stability/assembly factor-like uncharacterized protein
MSSLLNAQAWTWNKYIYDFNINDLTFANNGKCYVTGSLPLTGSEISLCYVSQDSCKSWSSRFLKGNTFSSNLILVNPKGRIFVACSKKSDGVIYRSDDDGLTWDTIYTGTKITSITANDKGILFVGNALGQILFSTDEGDSWITKKTFIDVVSTLVCDSKGNIFAGTSNGLFFSEDNGYFWKPIEFFSETSVSQISIDKFDRVFVSCGMGSFFSTDSGISWKKMENYSFYALAQGLEGSLISGQQGGIFQVDSSLSSWKQIGPVFNVMKIRVHNSFAVALEGERMLYTFDLKMLNTKGSNFLPLKRGNKWQYIGILSYAVQTASIYSMSIDSVTADTAINNLKYYKLLSGNNAWYRYDENDRKIYIYDSFKDNQYMDFNLNDGQTFGQYSILDHNFHNVKVLEGNKTLFSRDVYYKAFNYLVYSTGFAGLHTGIQYGENFGPIMRTTSSSGSGVGSSSGGDYLVECILNEGDTLKKYYSNYQPQFTISPLLTVSDSIFNLNFSVNHRYTYIYTHIYYSNSEVCFIDTVMLFGYYKKGESVIEIQPKHASRTLFTTNYNLSFLLDMNLLKAGYSFYYQIYARDKGIIPTEKRSPENGFYKLDYTPDPSLVKTGEGDKNGFRLEQCYPNPVNSSTSFFYSVPRETYVNIALYNPLGQLVKELVNENKTSGIYKVNLSCENLTSGMYFYRIRAGGYNDVKKLIILK